MTTVFRLERGSRERYLALVEASAGLFDEVWGDIAPSGFAAVAWRLAIPPLNDPGYVRGHRRVLSAAVERNTWDGTLLARVSLVAPSPVRLGTLPTLPPGTPPTSPFGDDQVHETGVWQGWADTFGQFVAPTDHDIARGPFLRGSVLVEAPLPLAGLPEAPDGRRADLAEDADRAVAVLVRALDRIVAPVVLGLESSDTGQPR